MTGEPVKKLWHNARLVDPAQNLDAVGSLLVAGDRIVACGAQLAADDVDPANIFDATGLLLLPGLVDMRVFTGEPGFEYRETLASASEAAAAGGITTMVVMPNTNPVIDDAAIVDFILRRARDTAAVRIYPMAAITRGLAGEALTEIGLLQEAGAVAFTDATRAVANPRLFHRALTYARDFSALIVQHVEEPALAGGVMNAGAVATGLGLAGISQAAELIMLERDIRLVEMTGARYHAAQISCAASVEVMRAARARGLPVTCGVSHHHLLFTEADIGAWRTFFKLSPPLRSEADRQGLIAGVADGTIDVIVSGHDPQSEDTKRLPFAEADFGAAGLETLLAGVLSLAFSGAVPLARLVDALCCRPAQILGLDAGRLVPGGLADFCLVDPDAPWNVTEATLYSRSKNSPFDHQSLAARVVETVVGGRTVYSGHRGPGSNPQNKGMKVL